MKWSALRRVLVGLGAAFCALAGGPVLAQPTPLPSAAAPGFGPRLKFDAPVHDYGRINSGDSASHTFWFTNTGDAMLVISNVQPSCGCTATADWTRQVPPGEAGKIPIEFHSANFSGPVAKLITVVSNDTNQPASYLQIKADVWKPVEVLPSYAVITLLPDTSGGSAAVRVVNHLPDPLYLGQPQVNNTNFSVEVRTNMPGKEYQLVVSALESVRQGNPQAQITVPTSATQVPPLTVTVYASVQLALTILPSQLNLPAGPLPHRMTPVVTIINNTTNALSLSEPAIDLPGIDLQFREVQPGKYFTIAVSFPEGFELKSAANVALRVKSTHPKYPQIQVPVVQAIAPTPVPQAAAPANPARTPPLTVAPRRVLTRSPNPAPAPTSPAVPR